MRLFRVIASKRLLVHHPKYENKSKAIQGGLAVFSRPVSMGSRYSQLWYSCLVKFIRLLYSSHIRVIPLC